MAERQAEEPQPESVSALPEGDSETLDPEIQAYFAKCAEKLGFVPNVLKAFTLRPRKLRAFIDYSDELMRGDSGLSKLEREMIAVVVSSANHCHYCLIAHGWAVRRLSGDPVLAETLVTNYRAAKLPARQRLMLDFAWKLTLTPNDIGNKDRERLREAGFTEEDIFDIVDVAAFFNMSNRTAFGIDLLPNHEYHGMDR
jgi:uncharacterized peroxidase-related enzyme